MKTYLFFGYRDWAINVFKKVSKLCGEQWMLVTENRMCNKAFIDKINPDLIFFYGWSWIVPNNIIEKYTCLCLHPSPLPKYRGGSPIQNQIMNGETVSAVTIFKMNGLMDSGDILYQKEMSLAGYLPEILKRIEVLGVDGTMVIVDNYTNDYVNGIVQDPLKATIYPRRSPTQSLIVPGDFLNHEADYFYNLVRACQPPYPEAYIQFDRGRLIIEKVRYEL
jgi:methionyl-tRNA formyltransferase